MDIPYFSYFHFVKRPKPTTGNECTNKYVSVGYSKPDVAYSSVPQSSVVQKPLKPHAMSHTVILGNMSLHGHDCESIPCFTAVI